jgi:hypothetical protein
MMTEDITLTIKAIEKDRRNEFKELYRHFLRAESESEAAECLKELRLYNFILVDGVGFYEQEAVKLRARLQAARKND